MFNILVQQKLNVINRHQTRLQGSKLTHNTLSATAPPQTHCSYTAPRGEK